MKKFLFAAMLLSSISAFAGNGQCALCEVNRENNAKNVNPYPYYEDYLNAQKNGGVAPAVTPAPAPAAAPAAKPAQKV